MSTLTIEAKVLGQKKPLFTDWVLPLPPEEDGDRLRLRDLIRRVVQEEVTAFNQRQEERRLIRILSKTEIEQSALKGKIDLGGKATPQSTPADDPEAAVETALLAFTDGLYFVFVDNVQQTDLDVELFLKPDSRLTFIRLTPLAGG